MADAQTDVHDSATGAPRADASVACRGLWKVYGANGELLRVFENVYDAAGDLETAHTRHADGTETHVP